jgi:hypothetical protein
MPTLLVSEVSVAVGSIWYSRFEVIGFLQQRGVAMQGFGVFTALPNIPSSAPRLRDFLDTARAFSLEIAIPKHFECQTSDDGSLTRTDNLWQVPSPAVPHLHRSAVVCIKDGRYRV